MIAAAPGERKAAEVIVRLGGRYIIEPRFGLERLGVIVQVDLSRCAPTAGDLAEIKALRHLRLLDLSCTPIGDRELVQLVDSTCQVIVIPDGRITQKARNLFPEEQLALGIGGPGFLLPETPPFSPPARIAGSRDDLDRSSAPFAAARERPRAKRRPAGGKARSAAVTPPFAASLASDSVRGRSLDGRQASYD